MKRVGIYVHIPFCKQKCKYCDFISFSDKNELQEQYEKALLQEIENCEEKNLRVNTIYFGGGTPSIVPSNMIIRILCKIKEKFKVEEDAEITIEVNPGTVNEEKLQQYYENGFNRISIGLQATQNSILKKIGRIHSYEEFLKCYQEIKDVGFENINVDLMLALPLQTVEDLEESVLKVIQLHPNHISLYSLILEEGTPLAKEVKEGRVILPTEEEERRMYHLTKNILEKNGYSHYEISNFAQKGFESRHNKNCWNQEEYLGFGLAAHSYWNQKRYSNTNDLKQYIENQKENVHVHEIQTSEMEKKEYMMLGFRKIEGISISEFERKFAINPLFYFRFEIAKLVEEDLIEVDLDKIKLTEKGMDFANLVFQEFV